MSLQWTAIAGFLYCEMFAALLLIVPFISAFRWTKVFKSRIFTKLNSHSTIYFNILLIVLAVLFLDAIREVIKYSKMENSFIAVHTHDSKSAILMRLFRAQRNLYVSGFALFMWFILRRLVILITKTAQLEAMSAASLKQAQSASEAAKSMLQKGDGLSHQHHSSPQTETELKEKLETATNQLAASEKETERLELDLETLKKQYAGHNQAYDELLAEHAAVQKKLDMLEQKSESKKDN